MEDLRATLLAVDRPALLLLLAAAIGALTIRARTYYDQPDAFDRLRETNEAVHRVAGHLRALINPAEPFDAARAAGVAEQLELLTPAALDRLFMR